MDHTSNEESSVNRLTTLHSKRSKIEAAVTQIHTALQPLILPDCAKVLAAIAADMASLIESRNPRKDVQEACSALQKAIAALEAVNPNLDG